MSCRLGSCQHPPATSTLQLSVSPHVLCQTFAHLTFDVSMVGPGHVHTRCSSPRKYSRKRRPHHMRPILRTRPSFPRRRESNSCRPPVTSLFRHSRAGGNPFLAVLLSRGYTVV